MRKASIAATLLAVTSLAFATFALNAPTTTINRMPVRTGAYDLSETHSFHEPVVIPAGWSPDITDRPLMERMPIPMPAAYKQPFNPWSFTANARALCTHYSATQNADTRTLMRKLLVRFKEYSYTVDGARFVIYKFPHRYRKRVVPAPWTSAYASGAALIGLTVLDECAKVEGALDTAHEVLAGLARPISLDGRRPSFWVSFVDDDHYLWFEEMPLPGAEQPRVLNGHIRTLLGIHAYWTRTGNETARQLLLAGIHTIEHHAPAYRAPGKVNYYDLLKPGVPDYGPDRTVAQQLDLFRMTGKPIFKTYSEQFQADIDASRKQ